MKQYLQKSIVMKTNTTLRNLLSLIVLGSIISLSSYAKDINVSGKVVNESHNAISGVKVYLQAANMTDYTDASGNFSFYYGTPNAIESSSLEALQTTFDGNQLLLYCENQHVTVDAFDMTGRFVKRLVDMKNVTGNYAVYPKAYFESEAQPIYLIRVTIDSKIYGFKVAVNGGTVYSQGLHPMAAPDMPKANTKLKEANYSVDQLIFTHDDYETKTVSISNYNLNVGEVVLDPIASNNAPVLSGPSSVYGEYQLTWSYDWSGTTSADDHYELEYSYQENSGFQALIITSNGDRSIPYNQVLYAEAVDVGKTTYFRVRAKSGGVWSDYSNTIGVYCPMLEMTVIASLDNLMMYNSDNEAIANTNYKNVSLGVGANYIDGLYWDSWLIASSSLYFELMNWIEGRTIQQAILKLYVEYLPGDWNTRYKINPFAGGWNTNTITMNSAPNYYTGYYAIEDLPVTSAIPWEVDITSIVQAWASGVIPNHGILIRDNNIVFPNYTAYRATQFYSIETAPGDAYKPQIYLEVK